MRRRRIPKQLRIVRSIDRFVKGIYAKGGGDEAILENMQPYMNDFKKVMDKSTPKEMEAFCERYEGFYRFAKLLEGLAGAIQDGHIDVPE